MKEPYNKKKIGGTYSIELEVTDKIGSCNYILKEGQQVLMTKEDKIPRDLSSRSNLGKKIKEAINWDGRLTSKAVEDDFLKLMNDLQTILEELQNYEIQQHQKKMDEETRELESKKDKAKEKLKNINEPVVWIASLIDWQTAGERNNIILCFLAYFSQVVLGNPISVIGLGESGSGKTHIQQVAMGLIPSQFIVFEKKITESALFNRAKQDSRFYDGKIVNYGDMGGNNDLTFAEDSKNLMKELQSDGFLKKPLSIRDSDGNWVTKELVLEGRPCLTYTTVPGYLFDDQELSRSIFITPRMDNQASFEKRSILLECKGKSYKQMIHYMNEYNDVKYMVYALKDIFKDIEIINPYSMIIAEFLKESNYYKRDFPKYNNLLKTITALNYYSKDVCIKDDKKYIYTDLNDIHLFMSILKPYQLSIVSNLSPKATEILQYIYENKDDFTDKADEYRDVLIRGFSISEFIEVSNNKLNLSKRSIQTYFNELDDLGYLKVIGKYKGNENRWELTDKGVLNYNDLLTVTDDMVEIIKYEIGEELANFVANDSYNEALNINNQHKLVNKPIWSKIK